MDEPTESLDPLIRQQLFDVLRGLQRRGVTVFMSSHVLADVEEICERVALIRNGRIVSFGPVDDLRKGQVRTMIVTLRDPVAPFGVMGASVVSREGATVKLSVTGDINDLVRTLAAHDVQDIVYERMSLDELFMGFYREGQQEDTPHA
jgi:ABC-2 type transport system ATP-binding protein